MRFLPTSFNRKSTRKNQRCLLANEDGTAAIEFGAVALPFLLFVLGIIGYGLYFFTDSSLAHGVEAASRKIRTGEVNSTGTAREDSQMTVGEFRNLVCSSVGALIDCSKLRVIVKSEATWSEITPPSCTKSKADGGGISDSTGGTDDLVSAYSGAASQVVLVTVCYKSDLAQIFSFLKLPEIMQAAAAFKSEPYS